MQNPLTGVGANTYTVTITDALGCVVTANGDINEFDSPTAVASEDVIIEAGETTDLSVAASGGSSPYTYVWDPPFVGNPNGANTTAAPNQTTTYTVIVTDDNGCTAADQVVVTVVPPVVVVMPTAFSPNGDSDNEVYEPFIPSVDVTVTMFRVFDRWGKLLHDDVSSSWDGTFNGKEQPVGTYVYVVEYLDLLNRTATLKGHFNLVR